MNTLEDFLKTYQAGVILDIACGSGNFTRRLTTGSKSYTRVVGLDIKPSLKEDFLKNIEGQNITFIAAPIAQYLKTAETFDTISISNALHHLEGVENILRDLRQILSPNGTVMINEMYSDDLTPAQETQRDMHRFMADLHRLTGEYHRGAFTRAEIQTFFDRAGLKVLHKFVVPNRDAPIKKEGTDGMPNRIKETLEHAYPNGAPSSVLQELEHLQIRATQIGIAPPPQLTCVCRFK